MLEAAARKLFPGVRAGLVRTHAATGVGDVGWTPRNAVLVYHAVGHDPDAGYYGNVSTRQFRSSIEYLVENAEVVPHTDLLAAGDDRRVAVTFDDGLRSVYTDALPVLREFDVPATVFVNPAFVGDRNRELLLDRHGLDDDDEIVLTDDQLLELVESPLVRIGNHTRTHARLSGIDDDDELRDEIVRSKEILEDEYGVNVDAFSYPYGAHHRRSREIVEAHHEFSFMISPFLIEPGCEETHRLPRICAHERLAKVRWELSPASDALNGLYDRCTTGDVLRY